MRQRGFSLLEALVTLVIIAMIAALLMQSLVYVLGLRERILRHEGESRVVALHEQWFRDSMGAALADAVDGLQAFSGSSSEVALLGADSLHRGVVAAVGWRVVELDGGVGVEYVEEGRSTSVLSGDIDQAGFEYRDRQGRWHDHWPIDDAPGEALPRAVRLNMRTGDDHRTWWVAIPAAPALPPALSLSFDASPTAP